MRYVEGELKALGYRVIVTRNAPAALEILRGPEKIDLLFTDVVMPGGMFGTELAKEAARLRPDLKILLTSGYTEHPVEALDGLRPRGADPEQALPPARSGVDAAFGAEGGLIGQRSLSPPQRSIARQERDTSRKTTTRFATNSIASMTKIRSIGPFNTGQYATPTRPPRIRTGRL